MIFLGISAPGYTVGSGVLYGHLDICLAGQTCSGSLHRIHGHHQEGNYFFLIVKKLQKILN